MAQAVRSTAWSRRELLRGLGLVTAWAACPTPLTALPLLRRRPDDLPAPDLADTAVLRLVAGLRPYRDGHIRLEPELLGDTFLVHAYGHGGCGVSLSWGTAEEAADLVLAASPGSEPVAVLGAGAVGLATARVLQERGRAVHLYAAALPPDTTSNVAGALWLPTGVAEGRTTDQRRQFQRLVVRSWQRFAALRGRCYPGVADRPLYDTHGNRSYRSRFVERWVPSRITELERVPLPGADRRGFRYRTFLVEPPVYMDALLDDVRAGGAEIVLRRFEDPAEIACLPERVVVNAMGLGAGAVFADAAVTPVRGQLVHLRPQELPYALSFDGGYLFPRADAVVLGGTFETGVTTPTPDARRCASILGTHRRFFGQA